MTENKKWLGIIALVLTVGSFAFYKTNIAESSGFRMKNENSALTKSKLNFNKKIEVKKELNVVQNKTKPIENKKPETNTKGMVTLSFDDGWESQYQYALPLLSEAGIKGTFYIISDTLIAGKYINYMNESQVLDVFKQGHEIGSHTMTHSDLTATSTPAKKEITESKQVLEKLTGHSVDTFAYPYGAYNPEITQMIKDTGYKSARTVNPGTNGKDENAYLLKAISPTSSTTIEEIKAEIDAAAQTNTWLIITFHEVNTGREYSYSSDYIKEVISYIKEKNIPTVTVSEGVSKLGETSTSQNPSPDSSGPKGEHGVHLEANLIIDKIISAEAKVYANSESIRAAAKVSIPLPTQNSTQDNAVVSPIPSTTHENKNETIAGVIKKDPSVVPLVIVEPISQIVPILVIPVTSGLGKTLGGLGL